jgi:hypothetical protein
MSSQTGCALRPTLAQLRHRRQTRGEGKLVVPPRAKARPLAIRSPSGFMAAARRATPPSGRYGTIDLRPVRAPPAADGDWKVVARKKEKKKKERSQVGEGRFNCFSNNHLAKHCPNPSCCFRCREPGHQAHDCSLSHFSQAGRRRQHGGPPLLPRDLMPSGTSCSTDDGLGRCLRAQRLRWHRPWSMQRLSPWTMRSQKILIEAGLRGTGSSVVARHRVLGSTMANKTTQRELDTMNRTHESFALRTLISLFCFLSLLLCKEYK